MEVDRLNEFLVLAKYGKLAPAARELFMSPSTLSDHIIALENELGGPLFDRAGGFELTAAGENVLERSQRILKEYAAMRRACSTREGSPITLRVPNYSFGLKPFVTARDSFQTAHPGLTVSFKTNELQMSDPFDILSEGTTDVACLYTIPGSEQDADRMVPAGLAHVPIGKLDYVFLTTQDHPLAGKKVLSVSDFDGTTLLTTLCPLADIATEGVQAYLGRLGAHVEIMYRRLNRHDDILETNLDGYLIGRTVGTQNTRNVYDESLVVHQLDFPLQQVVNLVWDNRRLDEGQREFMAYLGVLAKRGEPLL